MLILSDVMTVKREGEDELVYGTRAAERVAGLVLGVAGAIVAVATSAFAAVVPAPLVVLPGLSALLGLCVALSNRRFAFRRDSHTCVATIHAFGVIRRRCEWSFTAIQIHRRFHWQLTRWLYVLVLVDRGESEDCSLAMGYAGNRNRAEKLARKLAAFTQTEALDHTGRNLEEDE